jgi:hypothetical protein
MIPDDWKEANVTPIFKKGSTSTSSNYRLLSLGSHNCTLLESIIRDSIVAHFKENNLLKDLQHGFTSGRSCLTN